MNDPTEPLSLPTDVRSEAFTAALLALEWVIGKRGDHLDLFGPLELLDLSLDEAEARVRRADTTGVRTVTSRALTSCPERTAGIGSRSVVTSAAPTERR